MEGFRTWTYLRSCQNISIQFRTTTKLSLCCLCALCFSLWTEGRPGFLLDFQEENRTHGSINYGSHPGPRNKLVILCSLNVRFKGTHVWLISPLNVTECETFVFLLVSCGLRLATLPWMPFLRSVIIIVKLWKLTLTETNETSSSSGVRLGSFLTSRMDHSFRPATSVKVSSFHWLCKPFQTNNLNVLCFTSVPVSSQHHHVLLFETRRVLF